MKWIRRTARHNPERFFYATVGFLGISYALIVAIDVFDIFGFHSWWAGDQTRQYFWLYWFHTPVEVPTQWLCLTAVAIVFFWSAGAAYQRRDTEVCEFSSLFGVAAMLMLAEDSLNIRHHLRYALEDSEGAGYSVLGTLSDLGFFALLGGLLVFVFLRFRHLFWDYQKVRTYLIRAYLCYAIAVGSSWVGPAFRTISDDFPDVYTLAGTFFTRLLFFDGAQRQEHFQRINEAVDPGTPTLEYYFMDRVWEESFELLGASALLVAALAFFFATTRGSDSDGDDDPDVESVQAP